MRQRPSRQSGVRAVLGCAIVALAFVPGDVLTAGQAGAATRRAGQSPPGEWWCCGGDSSSTKYSPLDQINRDNVKNLRIAWRWKSDNPANQSGIPMTYLANGRQFVVAVGAPSVPGEFVALTLDQ